MDFLRKLAGAVCLNAFFLLPAIAQINAGPDLFVCQGTTVTLNAVASGGYGTDSYTFEVFPFQPEAYTGGTPVTFSGNQDDQIAGPFNLGFQFCFFNTYYNQFYIGSNGWVGFSYSSSWTTYTSQAIPSTSSAVPKNCIMAPWQDWHPGVSSSYGPPYVFYKTVGTAPNRKLVVYWKSCPMYSCTTTYGTFQIVLNEQSSIIENHITNKPNCTSWAGGTATQGVHNSNGTIAFTATNRNSTQWTVTNESTRFVPSGIKWYTGGYPGGTIVGYGPELIVTPPVTTTYTAVVNLCGGLVYTDDVVVTIFPTDNAAFSYGSSTLCQSGNSGLPVTSFPGGSYTATPAGLQINPSTGNINLGASNTGTYTVTHITNGTCPDTASIVLSVVTSPSATFAYPLPAYCETAQNPLPVFPPGSTAGTFTATPTGLVFANQFTGEINLAASNPGTYSVTNTIPPNSVCPSVNYTTQIQIGSLPPTANTPVGPTDFCENPANTQYSTTPLGNTQTYTWTLLPAAAGTIQSNGPNALVNWSDQFNGPAGIKVSGGNACGEGESSPPLIIHISPLPKETGTPEGPESVCQGQGNAVYETSGSAFANNYDWELTPANAGSFLGNGQSISINWSATFNGTAQLRVRGVNDCGTSIWSEPLSVLISPLPATPVQPQGQASFCTGENTATYNTGITANATSYQWSLLPADAGSISGNSVTSTVNWNPLFTGTAQITVAGVNGCGPGSFSEALLVAINSQPQTFAGNDTTITANTAITLKGSVEGSLQDIGFHWEPESLCVNPDVMRPQTVPLMNTTLFTLTATNNLTTCFSTDQVLIEVEGAPLFALIQAEPATICEGDVSSVSVQAFGGTGGNYQYSWYLNGILFSNQQVLSLSPASTTTYEVEVTDGISDFSGEITVEVRALPLANAGSDLQVPFLGTAQLNGSASPAGNFSWQWQPATYLSNAGIPNPVTLPLLNSLVFSLVVTDQYGCVSASDEVTVLVEGGGLAATPVAVPDTLCFGESATLYASPSGGVPGGYTYRWTKDAQQFSDLPSVVITPEESGIYNLELNDGYNTVNRSVSVTVNPLPVVTLIGPGVQHEGNTILSCVFDTVTIPLSNTGSRFLWSDGSTGNKIDVWTSGLSFDFREIWVEVTDTLTGCQRREEVNVLFNFLNCSYAVEDTPSGSNVRIYPNPATEKIKITSVTGYSGQSTVQLIGMKGGVLAEKQASISGEGCDFDLSLFSTGLYLVRVISGTETTVVKIMVMKNR